MLSLQVFALAQSVVLENYNLMPGHTENELRDMLQALPMPACLFDAEARCFVASNADFCKLVGYTDAELIALPWYKLLADEHVKPAEIAMQLEAPEEAVAWRLKTKDGTPLSVAAKGRRMKFIRDSGKQWTRTSLQ